MTTARRHPVVDALNALDRRLCAILPSAPAHDDASSIDEAIAMAAKTTDLALSPELDCERSVGEIVPEFLTLQVQAREVLLQDSRAIVSEITQSICRLGDVGSTPSLDAQLCSELRGSLGFVHVAISVVEADRLRVEYVDGVAPSVPVEMSAADSAIEMRCMRGRSALMASGPTATPGYAGLLESDSYVVAAAEVERQTTILVHAARGELTTSADVQLIDTATFAYTILRERLHRVEQLRTQQQRLTRAAARLTAEAENIAASTLDLSADNAVGWTLTTDDKAPPTVSALSRRESDVCELIAVGASNAEIAESLVLSVETVKSHVKRVLHKLGVANRSEVIAYCAEAALTSADGQSKYAGEFGTQFGRRRHTHPHGTLYK